MSRSLGFVDQVKIFVSAGCGGRGCVSFRRESNVPRGGPNGGSGGRGGNVILEGDSGLLTLLDFKYQPHIKAQRGGHGLGKDCDGKKGKDVIAKVPLGTVVKDIKTGKVFGEILEPEQKLIVAHGGRGGRGNKQFATATDRAPRKAEPGQLGEERRLELELKLIADIGLVGTPNAGKSTFINYISTTKSKVAAYPFTTLNPVLGVVDLDRNVRLTTSINRQISKKPTIVVADIPGLIKDAHKGRGLGDKFLRHIERTKILVFILDIGDKPVTDYLMLKGELAKYSSLLTKKPYVIAINKMDLRIGKINFDTFMKESRENKNKVFPISALKGNGIDKLLDGIIGEINETARSD